MLYCLIVILLILLIVDRWKPRNLVKLHQKLGTDWPYMPIIGHAYKFIGNNEALFKALTEVCSQAYKRKIGTISVWLGFRLVVVTADIIEGTAVLKTAFDKKFSSRFTYDLVGNGSVFAPAEIWHRRRKILVPTFASRHIKKYLRVFEANAKEVAKQLGSRVGKGNFSCWNYISRQTLDSVCETTLGVNIGVLKEQDHPFFKALEEICKIIADRLCKPWLQIDALYKLLLIYKRQKHTTKIIHEFIDDIINRKKSLMAESALSADPSDNSTAYKSFLELMIENSEKTDTGYTEEELREEALVLLIAGTDTTATAICFIFVLLSQHQDVQGKVYKELVEILGNSNKPIEIEDLGKLKYTEAVIKETLRLYSPVPVTARDSKSDFMLPSGLTAPKGCDFIVHILGIHHNPRYWGEDVEEFKPERFLKDEKPDAFVAFSNGPRNCVGYLYAMVSIKATLAIILRRYRLLPATSFVYDKKNPLRLSFEFFMKHLDNYKIQIEYRD